ncbi:SDR family NAD(P)-dependent oxidoreductase [Agaribacter marinus]|uniref:Short-chain dehydrogenase n=1 Tax=Agaribacter marinus TaxID=1431249 RepID=A0AA37T1A3_9ALTE|nr:SDR family NAD(P)-dependent oxidoreductase [Agaribacter marinus]GLR70538.1 short-chain dehydrogenase [Agaribacter marinus]
MLKNNNRVLITGANRGIGLGLAEQYLLNGYHVIAACRSAQNISNEMVEKWGEQLLILEVDLASDDSIQQFSSVLKSLEIKIDILINNAGITDKERFGEWSYKAFSTSLAINAIGPAILVQSIKQQLTKFSKIINVSSGLASIAGIQDGQDIYTSYAMSKVAINMLNKQLSLTLPSSTVIALNPGWVRTEMGGPEATDSIEDACSKMFTHIESLNSNDSGKFIDYDGNAIDY